jgi:Spy/CpxP family protein refolding chaperone
MKIRQLVVTTLATALLVPTVIWAADHVRRGGMGSGMGAGPFGMGGGNILRLADKLGLSSDQVTQIKAIISAAQSVNQPTRDQLEANQQAFNTSYNPAQFDANAVNAYIAQQTPLVQQLVVSGFQTEAKVLAVLTPSQLTQFNQLRAQSKEWWQSHPDRP